MNSIIKRRQWWLYAVLLAFMSAHCAKAERACKQHEDCPATSAKRFCFHGFCSEQACDPGAKALCFEGPIELVGEGVCRSGTRVCDSEGQWLPCQGQMLPQIEICDRRDNNCDGTVDQAKGLDCRCDTPGEKQTCYSGPPGTETKPDGSSIQEWMCQEGIQYCEVDNMWGPCYAESVPTSEVCDKRDNDCDGDIDEGIRCKCTPGIQRACPNNIPKRGLCKVGTQTCESDGVWGACEDETPPTPEVCDGKDNDCDGSTDGARVDCKGVLLCLGGKCLCPPPLTTCGNKCTITDQNSLNCGACGNKCPLGSICESGACRCPNGQTSCTLDDGSTTCVDTQTKGTHCGKCNNSCEAGDFCNAGICERCSKNLPTCGKSCCGSGQACCNNTCADLQQDAVNCGACGTQCKTGQACCKGTCIDINTDTNHCGGCDSTGKPTVCQAKERCCAGACIAENDTNHCGGCGKPCAPGEGCCEGICKALQTDAKNCSSCGNECTAGQTCCGQSGCKDTKTDTKNCGGCGNQCAPNEGCCEGVCKALQTDTKNCRSCGNECTTGQTCCGLDGCIDTKTDKQNCGSCGVACGGNEVCCNGKCFFQACPKGKAYPSATMLSIRDVAVDSKGNVYVMGNYTNEISIMCPATPGAAPTLQTLKTRGQQDIFLLKLDPTGTDCVWLRGAGGDYADEGRAIAIALDDYVHITGAATENFQYYVDPTKPESKFTNKINTRQTAAFILSVRPGGTAQSTLATPVSATSTIGYDIAVRGDTTNGRAFIVGQLISDGMFGSHKAAGHNTTKPSGFVAAFNLQILEFDWAMPKSAPTPTTEFSGIDYSLQTGYLGVAGKIQSNNNFDHIIQTYEESSGTLLRSGRSTNNAPLLRGIAIAANPKGGWYVTGHSAANLGATTFAESFLTHWIPSPTVKNLLTMTWSKPVLLLHLASQAIAVDSKGQAYIAGGFDEVVLGGKRRFGVAVAGYNMAGKRVLLNDATSSDTLPGPTQAHGIAIKTINTSTATLQTLWLVGRFTKTIDFDPPLLDTAAKKEAGFTWQRRLEQ